MLSLISLHKSTVKSFRLISGSMLSSARRKLVTLMFFTTLLLTHLVLLPAHELGTAIGWLSFQYVSKKIIFFSLLLASLETVLILLWIELIVTKSHCKVASGSTGFIVGTVSPLLCCTPLLPTLLTYVSILAPIGTFGITVQYISNIYQEELLLLAALLLSFAVQQNIKQLKNT